ncbi:MAG: translocation/assembly module TamB domain-containing protein [Deltaproteobacteria bacterium]|nr:translocation/assembly module TamB domain-containing protein [Deltaproteobacteria bacterium]
MRKWLRRLAWPVGISVILVTCSLIVARTFFHGPRLCRFIFDGFVNPYIRGRIEVDTIEWEMGDLATSALTTGRLPVRARGARLIDASGKKILDAPRVHGTLRLWDAISPWGYHDLLFDDLVIEGEPGGRRAWCLVEEILTPNGLFASEVGLLAAFDAKKRPPKRHADETPSGQRYDLPRVTIKDLDLQLHFVFWKADFENMSTRDGTLFASVRDPGPKPLIPVFTFETTTVRADRASLDLLIPSLPEPLHFDFQGVRTSRFAIPRDRMDALVYDLTARSVEGAAVRAHGELKDMYGTGGVELAVDAKNAGGLARRLSHGVVQGDHLEFAGTISGSYEGPKYTAHGTGVELALFPLLVENFELSLDSLTGDGEVPVLEAQLLGGKAELQNARFHVPPAPPEGASASAPEDPIRLDATLSIKEPLDLAEYLPREAVVLAGNSWLSGQVHAKGTVADLAIQPELLLGRNARIKGRIRLHDGVASARGLTLSMPDAGVTVNGPVDLKRRVLDLRVKLAIQQLSTWLKLVGAPPVASSLTAEATAKGSWTDPSVHGDVTARGVPVVGSVEATLDYRHDLLAFPRLLSRTLGGEIVGRGQVHLGPSVTLSSVALEGRGLLLSQVLSRPGVLGGRLDFSATASGEAQRPKATLDVEAQDLAIMGFPLGQGHAQLALDTRGIALQELQLGDKASSTIMAKGRVGYDRSLELQLSATNVALEKLPGLVGEQGPVVTGRASLDARAAGTLDSPMPGGLLTLAGVTVRKTVLGGASVKLEPWPKGRLHVMGRVFENKLSVDGVVALAPPYAAEAKVEFRRLEIDEFFPEMAESLGMHGWITGHAKASVGKTSRVELRLAELLLTVDGVDERGRPRPVTIRNTDPVTLLAENGTVRFLHPVRLATTSGGFVVEGQVGENKVDLAVRGQVQLVLLSFFTRRFLDETRGDARVDIRITGTPAEPRWTGSLDLMNAAARPRGQETYVHVPRGRVTLDRQRIAVENLQLQVDGATVTASGELSLIGLVPIRVHAAVKGRLSAKMLEVIFPKTVSAAGGSAALDIRIDGAVINPSITGMLTFDGPFQVAPRGFRRDLVLSMGKVKFTNQEISVREVRGMFDEAPIVIRGGPEENCHSDKFCPVVRLFEWNLIDFYVHVAATGLVHRIPEVLDLVLDADLRLYGDKEELQLRGSLDIVDGRYNQSFSLVNEVLVPTRTRERSVPFWEGNPLLEQAVVNLTVNTSGAFLVDNNIATLALRGKLDITGTPKEPKLDGTIQAESGTISGRWAGIRPRLTLRVGTLSFTKESIFPKETPTVRMEADADFEDENGQRHLITLKFEGTLEGFKWDLYTDTGLNAAQTLLLVTTGMSDTDELIRGKTTNEPVLRDSAAGTQTSMGSSSSLAGLVDTYAKEYGGELIMALIEDPIRQVVRLDCFRFELGIESGRLNVCKNIIKGLRLEGDWEQAYRGGANRKASIRYQAGENLSGEGTVQYDTPQDETLETKTLWRLLLRYRYVIQPDFFDSFDLSR